ncbi:uncharacterized protein LOC119068337 [Bradysia coprophila]|uniref:uncharacterized protein LOC119068337 n=1 Tax=Bradysia coprophila TaxID=38358 RepID=UPI00187D8681|nr:uncharacterized protein LOC119068337 [Bradysia coprophila]
MRLLICVLMTIVVLDSGIAAQDDDSYLSALQNSHDVDTLQDGDNRVARDDFQPSVEHHHHDSVVSSPVPNYEYPKPEYGAPSYPKTEYGPPSYNFKPVYGAPIHHPVYRVPQHNHYDYLPAPTYNAPRDNWFSLDKFKFNFDLFTVGKILLKLLIFKKIIKFMALICLLLFLPKLQSDSTTSTVVHDEGRQLNAKYDLKTRIDETTKFAVTAVNAFKRKYPDSCLGPMDLSCKFGKMFDTIDDKYSYESILRLYLPDSVTPDAEEPETS